MSDANGNNDGVPARTESYADATSPKKEGDESSADHGASPDVAITVSGGNRRKEAQKAFKSGDAEYSKAVHEQMKIAAEEQHDAFGEYVKVMVFGGLDGIVTTFAVVASVAGADLATEVVLVMGFANLLADGVSMAFGEFISGDAEQKYASMERQREKWELENDPEAEVKEMVDLYMEKGFDKADAESVIKTMSKYRDFFVDHMMTVELEMMPPDHQDTVLRGLFAQSAVMFFSFLVFGLVPLLAYLAFSTVGLSAGQLFGISCGLTAVALFALGAYSSRFSKYPWYRQGIFVMINGATAAAVAYLVGWGVASAVGIDGGEC